MATFPFNKTAHLSIHFCKTDGGGDGDNVGEIRRNRGINKVKMRSRK